MPSGFGSRTCWTPTDDERSMKILRFTRVASVVLACGCATTISANGDSIAKLEQARVSAPNSEPAQRAVGVAYFKANRFAEARTALQRAVSMAPGDGVAALYLGL